jgi:hypothetical protein
MPKISFSTEGEGEDKGARISYEQGLDIFRGIVEALKAFPQKNPTVEAVIFKPIRLGRDGIIIKIYMNDRHRLPMTNAAGYCQPGLDVIKLEINVQIECEGVDDLVHRAKWALINGLRKFLTMHAKILTDRGLVMTDYVAGLPKQPERTE